MVPLGLKENDNSKIVWQNPHPSSPKRCIPNSFEFAKETTEKTQSEIRHIKRQIQELQPVTIVKNKITYIVTADMVLTMVDGKVCQALSDTPSAATCYICGATPSQMNKLEMLKEKDDNEIFFEFGLSIFHMWIRMMECILHIAYRLEFCKWSAGLANTKTYYKVPKKELIRNSKRK